MNIVQFEPAVREPGVPMTRENFFRVRDLLSPEVSDDKVERGWACFNLMRQRVRCPRRRGGGPHWRIPNSIALVPDPLPFEGEAVDLQVVQ